MEVLEFNFRSARASKVVPIEERWSEPAFVRRSRTTMRSKVTFAEIEEDFTLDLGAPVVHPVFRPAHVPLGEWVEMRNRENAKYDWCGWGD
jgi:hypothetical protein